MELTVEVLQKILAAGLGAAAVLILGALGAQAKPNHRGWRQIKAGPMHWTGLILGGALTVLMSYVWLFVGSSRPDAETQMTILFCLICAFGLTTVGVGIQTWLITKKDLRWRGRTIRFSRQPADEARAFDDVISVAPTPLGAFALLFQDGTKLKLDPYALGAQQLLDALESDLQTRHSA